MKAGLFLLLAPILLLSILILRPVPIVEESDALVVSGTVSGIFEGGEKDIVIRIKGDTRFFYINRGLENGLDIPDLKAQLMYKNVTIKYPEYWTPLDWNSKTRHVSKLESDGIVLFNELR